MRRRCRRHRHLRVMIGVVVARPSRTSCCCCCRGRGRPVVVTAVLVHAPVAWPIRCMGRMLRRFYFMGVCRVGMSCFVDSRTVDMSKEMMCSTVYGYMCPAENAGSYCIENEFKRVLVFAVFFQCHTKDKSPAPSAQTIRAQKIM